MANYHLECEEFKNLHTIIRECHLSNSPNNEIPPEYVAYTSKKLKNIVGQLENPKIGQFVNFDHFPHKITEVSGDNIVLENMIDLYTHGTSKTDRRLTPIDCCSYALECYNNHVSTLQILTKEQRNKDCAIFPSFRFEQPYGKFQYKLAYMELKKNGKLKSKQAIRIWCNIWWQGKIEIIKENNILCSYDEYDFQTWPVTIDPEHWYILNWFELLDDWGDTYFENLNEKK